MPDPRSRPRRAAPRRRSLRAAPRLRALLLAIVAVLLVLPASAGAHGGALLLEGEAGAYALALNAGSSSRDPGAVDFTVTLRRDGRPEEAADVTLRIRDGADWSQPYAAERAANTYEVVLSQPERNSWKSWDVRVEIDGPGGPATVTHLAGDDQADGGGAPVVPLVVSLAAVAALALAAVLVRRRRAAGSA